MRLRMQTAVLAALLLVAGCSKEYGADAYGQFEADEITISAEVAGRLLQFDVQEGMALNAGEVIGHIDTTALDLKRGELEASVQAIQWNISKLEAQAEVYRTQLATAQKNLDRVEKLVSDNAATQQQLDDLNGQINTLNAQIKAVEVQKRSVYAEITTMKTRIDQIEDQIRRATVINPVHGVVLTTYAEEAELVGTGKPLYQIADLRALELRVFVSGAQLPNVKLGSQVEVLIDADATTNQSLSGIVSWISSEAEFTPKMIQTKEERVTQVYAVKVRVSNPDGTLKIGMPGEVNF